MRLTYPLDHFWASTRSSPKRREYRYPQLATPKELVRLARHRAKVTTPKLQQRLNVFQAGFAVTNDLRPKVSQRPRDRLRLVEI